MAACDVCVNLSDIMTPQSFSTLITTLIKYLVYEKQLIPYPYDRLKLYVKKYKELNLEENDCCDRRNKYKMESEKYYKKVSDVVNSLDTVFQCIEKEFRSQMKNHIESVVILVGSSVLNPLTVFNISVPELSYSSGEKQHSSRQHIDNVFRCILNNDKFNDILTSNITVETNLYVMFKVKKGEKMVTDWCLPKEQFRTFRGKQIVLRFDLPENEVVANNKIETFNKDGLNFDVFVDVEDTAVQINNTFTKNVVDWYIGKHFITGFKNYKYNGIPISDTWLNPNIIDSIIL